MDESVPTLARCVPSAVPAGASLGRSKGTALGAFGDVHLTMGAESGVPSGGADLHGAIGRDGEMAVEEASEAERRLSRLPLVCSPCAWPRWLIGSLPPAHLRPPESHGCLHRRYHRLWRRWSLERLHRQHSNGWSPWYSFLRCECRLGKLQ